MSSAAGETVDSRSRLLRAGWGVALAAGAALALALVYQQIDVYFTIGGDSVVPTHAEKARYVWTATAGLSAVVLSLVLALIVPSGRRAWWSAAGIVVMVIVAGVFAVPHDRWSREAPTYEPPTNYTPCYSGSEDCGAGG